MFIRTALSSFRHAGSEAWKSDTTYRRMPRRFDARFSSGICPAYGLREGAGPPKRLTARLIRGKLLIQQRRLDTGGPVLDGNDDVDDHGDRVQGDGQRYPGVVEVGQDSALTGLKGSADRVGDRLDAREPVGKHGEGQPYEPECPERVSPWRVADEIGPGEPGHNGVHPGHDPAQQRHQDAEPDRGYQVQLSVRRCDGLR